MYKNIEKLYILLPGLSERFQCGGLQLTLQFADLWRQYYFVDIVTYLDREVNTYFLDDLVDEKISGALFVVTWGPDIEKLVTRLQGKQHRVINLDQGTKWHVPLPDDVPCICTSRYIMSSRAVINPRSSIYLLNPVVELSSAKAPVDWVNRKIDVLYISRKSTAYLNNQLIPAIREKYNVYTVSEFVPQEKLMELYSNSKLYIYDSDRHWAIEGFGLQPLEALLNGCVVFSNIHGGLSDYLTPEINMFPIGAWALPYDVKRISSVLDGSKMPFDAMQVDISRDKYSVSGFLYASKLIFQGLDFFYMNKN